MTKASGEHWTGNPYKRPGSPYWSVVFTDVSGVVRRRSTKTKDLRIARDYLAEKLREVERLRAGHVDKYAESRKTPIADFVTDYKKHLEAEQSAPRYVKGTIRMIREFLAFAKVATLPGIALQDAERFVADVSSRRSVKTRDHFAGSLRSFGRWLERTGRWERDPFHGLRVRTANRDKFRVFKRVSFRFEEAEKLVEGAFSRYEAEFARGGVPTQDQYADGDGVRDRMTLYWFCLTTAFRAKECGSVRWEDLVLDGPKLSVRLAGIYTKNGNDALIPLQPFVAEALKAMRIRRSLTLARRDAGVVNETDFVFHVPDKIGEIVRKDAAHAGLIPLKSPTTKRVDFHCLRKSCARILIEMNVHPKVIQQTLRHADITTTMAIYGELGEDDLFRELPGKFPVPKAFGERQHDAAGRLHPREECMTDAAGSALAVAAQPVGSASVQGIHGLHPASQGGLRSGTCAHEAPRQQEMADSGRQPHPRVGRATRGVRGVHEARAPSRHLGSRWQFCKAREEGEAHRCLSADLSFSVLWVVRS